MDAIECIKTRMSIRKFKPDPIPLEILENIIDIAKWSPSYKNSQPWEAIIISGKKKDALSNYLIELLEKDYPACPDLPTPQSWPHPIEARINALMQKRSELIGKDLNAPDLPVVIGELTGPWVKAEGPWAAVRKAQADAAARPEFKDTVRFVETHDFVRRPEDSPCPGHGHHE